MERGQFMKDYWQYKKDGGKLSMKEYAQFRKESAKEPDFSELAK